MILFSCNNPNALDVYVLNKDHPAETVSMERLTHPIVLRDIKLTHRWNIDAADMGRGDRIVPLRSVKAKNFQSLHDLYLQRVGATGLTFEQWLSVLPGIGSGNSTVDYIDLYMGLNGDHWIVSITKAKLFMAPITESLVIADYKVHLMSEMVTNARQKAEERLKTIDAFGKRLIDGEFLGDISWRGSDSLDMESFITDYLFKE